jgi:hypothetical protein
MAKNDSMAQSPFRCMAKYSSNKMQCQAAKAVVPADEKHLGLCHRVE